MLLPCDTQVKREHSSKELTALLYISGCEESGVFAQDGQSLTWSSLMELKCKINSLREHLANTVCVWFSTAKARDSMSRIFVTV